MCNWGNGGEEGMLSYAVLEPCLLNSVVNTFLRDSVTRFLTLGFFHESGSPQPRLCTLTCKYLRWFLKKFEMTLMLLSEAWGGRIIHEKTRGKRSHDTVPLNRPFLLLSFFPKKSGRPCSLISFMLRLGFWVMQRVLEYGLKSSGFLLILGNSKKMEA